MAQKSCAEKSFIPVYTAISIVCCLGYFLVLKIMHKCRLLNKPHYLLLVFLSISDCAYVISGNSFYLLLAFTPAGEMCTIITNIAVYIGHVVYYTSCCLSVMLTVNQFIAVKYGLRYHSIVTAKKIKKLTLTCILLCIVANALVLLDGKYFIIRNTKMIRSRCILSFIVAMSGLIMLINLIYCNRVSHYQMKRLLPAEINSPYWKHRRRIRAEVTIITSVVIFLIIPQGMFHAKIQIHRDDFDDKYMAITRGMMKLSCALNSYLYLFTLNPLRKKVLKTLKYFLCCIKRGGHHNSKPKSLNQRNSDIYKRNLSSLYKVGKSKKNEFKYIRKEISELKSADIMQNQMSSGAYVTRKDAF